MITYYLTSKKTSKINNNNNNSMHLKKIFAKMIHIGNKNSDMTGTV